MRAGSKSSHAAPPAPPRPDHADVLFSALAVFIRVWFVHLVDIALSVPRLPSIVCFLFFYVFAQALGLLWGLVVVALQTLSRRLVEWLVSEAGDELSSPLAGLRLVARCYVLFATLRVLFLAAGGLWTLAWEASSDFPTVRKVMLRRNTRPGTPKLCIVLAVPMGVTTLAFAASGLVSAYCSLAGKCNAGWLSEQLLHADSRSNRMLRFSLVVIMLQWAQLFESLTPSGLVGLCHAASRTRKAALLLLLPVTLWRLTHFAFSPADHVFFGHVSASLSALQLSRHATDNLLSVLWGVWLTMAAALAPATTAVVPCKPQGLRSCSAPDLQDLRAAALEPDSLAGGVESDSADGLDVDQLAWKVVSRRFQYTFVLSATLYWARSVLSPRIGWSFAQNDLQALCIFYPVMCLGIWSATYAAHALWNARPKWAMAATGAFAASAIVVYPGMPTALAALHMMWSVHKVLGDVSKKFALHPRDSKAGVPSERRWARSMAQCMLFVLVLWFVVLSVLMLAATAQQRLSFYPGRMEFEADGPPGNATLRIGHRAIVGSYLTLSPEPSATQPPGTYGACGQTWGDLQMLDYALLSLAAYWDADDPQLGEVMRHLFPAGLAAAVVNGSHTTAPVANGMPWLEVEVRPEASDALAPPRRIIAVRGTDPTKVADIVEDIRMWTEPVMLAILSLFFPAIHAWPGPLVDNWVSTTHGLLEALELEAGPWMYDSLAAHLHETLPPPAEGGRSSWWGPILTGHSLGAGIAQVLAALTGAGVVAISPPGLLQSFNKHRLPGGGRAAGDSSAEGHARSPHRHSVSLVVEGDWVSRFDTHAGFVQTVACDQNDPLSVFGGCHLLENTICHLLTSCGDSHGRWQRCQHVYEPHVEVVTLLRALPSQLATGALGWPRMLSGQNALIALCAATALQLLKPEGFASLRRRRPGGARVRKRAE